MLFIAFTQNSSYFTCLL